MKPEIAIRPETNTDTGAITEVTVAAFETLEISNPTEQFIIEALRAAKALTVSLVAVKPGRPANIRGGRIGGRKTGAALATTKERSNGWGVSIAW